MLDPVDNERWNSLERRVAHLEDDMHDVKTSVKAIEGRLSAIEITLAKIDGRLDGIDGRMAGMEFRIAALPTTWTILGIVFTTWALGSGILIFAMNFLHR
jgi:hypothetical protein